jgi:hypothetical protein
MSLVPITYKAAKQADLYLQSDSDYTLLFVLLVLIRVLSEREVVHLVLRE